jgi:hypothetical protein
MMESIEASVTVLIFLHCRLQLLGVYTHVFAHVFYC